MQRTQMLRRAMPPTAVLLICLVEGEAASLLGLALVTSTLVVVVSSIAIVRIVQS